MSRKASRRRRNLSGGKASAAIALKPPPLPSPRQSVPSVRQERRAVPLSRNKDPLVLTAAQEAVDLPEDNKPLPRNRSLVAPGMPLTRRVQTWLLGMARRWTVRHEPLPEQPTLAQLGRMRKELATIQRRLDKMLG